MNKLTAYLFYGVSDTKANKVISRFLTNLSRLEERIRESSQQEGKKLIFELLEEIKEKRWGQS